MADQRIHSPSKSAPQDVIDPALRRGMMRVNPNYFASSIQEQERYRITMPEKDAFHIRQALLKALFGIHVKTDEEMGAAMDAFGDEEHLVLKSALLPAVGVGEDFFFLNESQGRRCRPCASAIS